MGEHLLSGKTLEQSVMETGAFGSGKAGSSVDPLAYLRKPSVVFRIGALLFSVIMFANIRSEGWQPNSTGKEICIMNESASACQFSNVVAVTAFLASIGFLVGEFFFDQMSSVKSRKHFVVADLSFSSFWTVAYLISFCTMIYQWSISDNPISGFGQGSVRTAIFCSFLSVFAWAGCALFSWQRYRQGFESAFTDIQVGGEAGYQQQEPPFQQSETY